MPKRASRNQATRWSRVSIDLRHHSMSGAVLQWLVAGDAGAPLRRSVTRSPSGFVSGELAQPARGECTRPEGPRSKGNRTRFAVRGRVSCAVFASEKGRKLRHGPGLPTPGMWASDFPHPEWRTQHRLGRKSDGARGGGVLGWTIVGKTAKLAAIEAAALSNDQRAQRSFPDAGRRAERENGNTGAIAEPGSSSSKTSRSDRRGRSSSPCATSGTPWSGTRALRTRRSIGVGNTGPISCSWTSGCAACVTASRRPSCCAINSGCPSCSSPRTPTRPRCDGRARPRPTATWSSRSR